MRAKRFLCIFICTLIITIMFGTVTTAEAGTAWDGTTRDKSWYTDKPYALYYTLSTGAELAGLAQLVNAGNDFTGKIIILAADIDLGSKTWTPIGTGGNPFNGTFDGGGHTVSGLSIGTDAAPDENFENIGLFGGANTSAIIKNVRAEVAFYLSGIATYAGGIAGYSYGIVINCFTTGTIKGDTLNQIVVGGIVGNEEDGKVENCASNVDITSCTLGGLVGASYEGFTLINCYATGNMTKIGSGGHAGGVCGYCYSSVLTNCYWNSDKLASPLGRTISTTQKNVTALTTEELKGAETSFNIMYYYKSVDDSQISTKIFLQALNGGRNAISIPADGSPVENWAINKDGYPVLVASPRTLDCSANIGSAVGKTAIIAKAAVGDSLAYAVSDSEIEWPEQTTDITYTTAYTSGADISAVEGQYIGLYETDSSRDIVAFNCIKLTANDFRQDIDLPGKGTSADPYCISSAENLQNLQKLVDGGKTYAGKTIVLTKDIDLSEIADWTPIGSIAKAFSGTFDGKGYAICNLKITGSSAVDTGLFGYANQTASFKNLFLKNIDIGTSATSSVGGVVGRLYGGSVTNCAVTGVVVGHYSHSCVGGMIGCLNSGTITNSCAAAAVTGRGFSGGLAGQIINTGSIAKNCYASGNVNDLGGDANVGGLAGYAKCDFINCYATGNVSGGTGTTSTGGFIGYSYNCYFKNCYATGDVTVTSGYAGGFIGDSENGALGEYYWNSSAGQSINSVKQTPGIGVGNFNGDTINGMSLADMQTGAFTATLNGNIASLNLSGCKKWKQAAGVHGSLPYLDDVGSVPALEATVSVGSAFGSTKITAEASSRNSLKYVVSSSEFATPVLLDTIDTVAPSAKACTSGADITGVSAGQYIGLYEVNSSGTIQKFKQIALGSGNVKVPAVPAALKAVATPASVTLTWGAVSGASGYEIYRAATEKGSYSLIASVTGTSYTNSALTQGSTYYYKIKTYVTVNGTKVYSDYTPVVWAKPGLSAPVVKAASASYNSVKLTWAAVGGAAGYEIYGAASSTGKYTLLKTLTTPGYTQTSLVTGKSYYYKVRAYANVSGKKITSADSTVVFAMPVPSAPGSFKAAKASSTSIKISYKAVSGANGYRIYRATSKNGTYSVVTTTSKTSYTNTKLTKNKGYYYKAQAYRTVSGKKVWGIFTEVKSAKPY